MKTTHPLIPLSSLALACCLVFGIMGCSATYEPHPHPCLHHESLPLTQAPDHAPATTLPSCGHIGVCGLQSQIVQPVGTYSIGKEMQNPLRCEMDLAKVSDLIGGEFTACGATVVRLPDDTQVRLLSAQEKQDCAMLLKGTAVRYEYSEHGSKQDRYVFAYIAIRFTLQRVADAGTLWEGEVAAYQKATPGPHTSQEPMAEDVVRCAARDLLRDPTFRTALAK